MRRSISDMSVSGSDAAVARDWPDPSDVADGGVADTLSALPPTLVATVAGGRPRGGGGWAAGAWGRAGAADQVAGAGPQVGDAVAVHRGELTEAGLEQVVGERLVRQVGQPVALHEVERDEGAALVGLADRQDRRHVGAGEHMEAPLLSRREWGFLRLEGLIPCDRDWTRHGAS
jgi:hypothetical protein